MKRVLLFTFVCLICLPIAVSAQRKRTVPAKTQPPVITVRPEKERVAQHIKNLTRFIYLLGGVAKGIEEIDAAARQGQVSQATINQTAQDKQKLVNSIANWRIAMDELVIDFRVKTKLQKYFNTVSGAGELAAIAEDKARAGQFSQSGQTLLLLLNKLTDTLVEMA